MVNSLAKQSINGGAELKDLIDTPEWKVLIII